MTHAQPLPPDPKGANDNRAARITPTLAAYVKARSGQPDTPETDAQDLVTDLLHWCDRNGVDAPKMIRNAVHTYANETVGGGQITAANVIHHP